MKTEEESLLGELLKMIGDVPGFVPNFKPPKAKRGQFVYRERPLKPALEKFIERKVMEGVDKYIDDNWEDDTVVVKKDPPPPVTAYQAALEKQKAHQTPRQPLKVITGDKTPKLERKIPRRVKMNRFRLVVNN